MNDPRLDGLELRQGAHTTREEGLCALEAVAWLAGEPHSDAPECTCPVIAAYVRPLNDRWSTADRQRLLPYLLRLIGTRSTPAVERRRGYLCADAAVRIFAPSALRAAGLDVEADRLAALPPIVDPATANAAASAARGATRDAAGVAWDACDDARAAASAAASAAARSASAANAAASAARAASAAARSASAANAAASAARGATRDAAGVAWAACDDARAAASAAARSASAANAAASAARAASAAASVAWTTASVASAACAASAAWDAVPEALALLDRLLACTEAA